MSGPRLLHLWALAWVLLFPGLLRADQVELNDGGVYTGKIIADDDASLTIRTRRGDKKLFKKDIAEVRRDGPAAETGGATDLPAYEITVKAPRISEATAQKPWDFMSAPDWGLMIEAGGVTTGIIAIDDGGSGCFEAPAGAPLTVRIIDIDLQEHDLVTDPLPLALDARRRTLKFNEGSEVEIVAIDPFDAEAKSGADAMSTGAIEVESGKRVEGMLDFKAQDRTDHLRLPAGSGRRYEGFVAVADGPLPQLTWVAGTATSLIPADSSPLSRHALVRVESGAAAVFRLRARAFDGTLAYHALFVEVGPDGHGRETLVRTMFAEAALKDDDDTLPEDADHARMVSALDCPAVRAAVVAGLDHASPVARATAAECAGQLGLREAAARLKKMAADDPSPRVRAAAGRAVDRISQ